MSYVVSQPQSDANPTDKYWVIKLADWLKAVHANGPAVKPVSEHETFEEAAKSCEKRNHGLIAI